ncbi:MAG: DUF1521 domain-containing protein [Acidobacteriota bacterium]
MSTIGNLQLGGQNITININNFGLPPTQVDAATGRLALDLLDSVAGGGTGNLFSAHSALPSSAFLPPPAVGLAGAPAGRGLQVADNGAITTAGGYRLEAEGRGASLKIFDPQGELVVNIKGDPHLYAKNGDQMKLEFDFTRDSNLKLGDGTLVYLDTTSQTGRSLLENVTVVNGSDRATIQGINTSSPETSGVTFDGYEWRADHLAEHQAMDTFVMGGSSENVDFWMEHDGVSKGRIVDSHFDREQNAYVQTLDSGQRYWVDAGLKPAWGSPAWGNELRGELNDFLAELGLPETTRDLFSSYIHLDHAIAELTTPAGGSPFGGLGEWFPSLPSATQAVHSLAHFLIDLGTLNQALGAGQAGTVLN